MSSYRTLEFVYGQAYVRTECEALLAEVEAAIFDVDGVLIDARGSYDVTIRRTVSRIAEMYDGLKLPRNAVTQKLIYAFRDTGGFNDDLNTTYAILLGLFAFSVLSGKDQAGNAGEVEDFLLRLASSADSKGIVSVEEQIRRLMGGYEKALRSFRAFLGERELGDKNIVVRVFNELFLGSELFEETKGVKASVKAQRGLIEDEKVIVKDEVLGWLSRRMKPGGLGLASGRGLKPTAKTLGRLINYFNRESIVFLEDEYNRVKQSKRGAWDRGKPNPYSLIKAAKNLNSFKYAIYVGDSVEDLLMTNKAKQTDPRLLFVGTYGNCYNPESRLKLFMKGECTAALASVNDLPQLFQEVEET